MRARLRRTRPRRRTPDPQVVGGSFAGYTPDRDKSTTTTDVRREPADDRRSSMMGTTGWFETVAEAQRRAAKRLPKSVYSALLAGSERGISVDDNTAAFAELGFAPHVAGLSAKR